MATDSSIGSLNPALAYRSFLADPDWRAKVALGGTFNALALVCILAQFMLLPVVFIFWALNCGYQLKIIRTRILKPDAPLPAWGDWLDLLISGLTWLAVSTGFMVFLFTTPTIALILGSINGAMYPVNPKFAPWAITTLAISYALVLFVGLIATYLQTNFAQEERMPAAFALFKVLRRIRTRGTPLVLAWLLSIGLTTAAIVVPTCTIIGIFLVPYALFIAGIISSAVVAQAWAVTEEA
jgi:hypothetical protein